PATSARGRGLAHRRTQDVGREEILSRQPAGEDRPAHLGGHHKGPMDLRAGSPTAERRTRSRSLRGTIMARPSPSCAHGDDRVRLPPASPTRDAPESGRIVLALSFRLVDPLRTKQATITLLQEEIAN